MVALRSDHHELARPQGADGVLERFVRAGRAVDADAAGELHQVADDGDVEDLLLAEEPERPARSGDHGPDDSAVQIAAMVEHGDHRPRGRDVLDSGDVETDVGQQLRALQRPRPVLQLAAGDLQHPVGEVEVADRPALHARQRHQPESPLTTVGLRTASNSGAS